jgi:SAM-dependent methyltransferase
MVWSHVMRPLIVPDFADACADLANVLHSHLTMEAPKVLEAGGGALSHVELPPSAHITVIDVSPEQLERNDYAHEKVLGDLHEHDFPSESFDVIVCWDVVEHLENPGRVLDAFSRWLKPGGLVVIAAPNPRSLSGLITKYTPHWFHVWALKNILAIKTAGQPGRGPFRTFMDPAMYPTQMAKNLEERGLRVVHLRCYASVRLEHLKQASPVVSRAFKAALGVLKIASFGRWRPEQSDFHLIARRPKPEGSGYRAG